MVNKLVSIFLVLSAALLSSGCDRTNSSVNGTDLPGPLEPAAVEKTNPMQVYAHYMPWFETPSSTSDGSWGQHWTMANCNPEVVDAQGKRQIASHYYPLIGPYASNDPTVLNYHCLLMKYSGIDGVMIDWYGTQEKYDYPENLRNTEALVKALDRTGLKFAIVYEDQTVNTLTTDSEKETQVFRDMRYLSGNFFNKENYMKIAGKPVLMIFGPQGVTTPAGWNRIFSQMSQKPVFIVLNGHSSAANNDSYKNSEGEFLWVNPNPDYEILTAGHEYYIGGAMPGFYDYYQEGGWGAGYATYEHEDGALFSRQLKAAEDAGLDILQISTWNDFGEGTTIEPTQEYGYRYLTMLQEFTGADAGQSDLELIYRWYRMKVKHSGASGTAAENLSQAFYYLIAMQPDKAEELIQTVEGI